MPFVKNEKGDIMNKVQKKHGYKKRKITSDDLKNIIKRYLIIFYVVYMVF